MFAVFILRLLATSPVALLGWMPAFWLDQRLATNQVSHVVNNNNHLDKYLREGLRNIVTSCKILLSNSEKIAYGKKK